MGWVSLISTIGKSGGLSYVAKSRRLAVATNLSASAAAEKSVGIAT
jgi:hypothetical protein